MTMQVGIGLDPDDHSPREVMVGITIEDLLDLGTSGEPLTFRGETPDGSRALTLVLFVRRTDAQVKAVIDSVKETRRQERLRQYPPPEGKVH